MTNETVQIVVIEAAQFARLEMLLAVGLGLLAFCLGVLLFRIFCLRSLI